MYLGAEVYLGTFWECRKVITHKCPGINVYPTSHLCVVLHILIFCIINDFYTSIIITGRNEVVAKVMFLLVSVILSRGGGLPQCMLGYHPPPKHTPGKHTPWQAPPQEAHTSPVSTHTPGIWSMSGRYASYWNAFLFSYHFIQIPFEIAFRYPFSHVTHIENYVCSKKNYKSDCLLKTIIYNYFEVSFSKDVVRSSAHKQQWEEQHHHQWQ